MSLKKKIFTLDIKSAFDESLTDSGLRLLIRFCLVFGTEHCKNSEKPWLKLKLPRSTYYRHMSDLVELQYLQRNPEDDSFSLSVPLLRRITVENPENGMELYKDWDSKPSSEREEKRTKREDKATHTIDTGLRKEKDTEYEDIEYSKPLENQYSVSSDDSNKNNILNAFVEQPGEEQKPPKRSGKPFVKPTLEEVKEYCRSRESTVSAGAFWDWYESNGWKVGKNPMKDWKAAVRTWEQKDRAAGKYTVPEENRARDTAGSGVSDECPF